MASNDIREFLVRYLMDEEFRKLTDNSMDDAVAEYEFDDAVKEVIKRREEDFFNLVFASQVERPKPSKRRKPFLGPSIIAVVRMLRVMILTVKDPTKVTSNLMAVHGDPDQKGGDLKPSIFFRSAVPSTPKKRSEPVLQAATAVQKAVPDDRRPKLVKLMKELMMER